MKVSLVCLCVLVHVALVHAGLLARNELPQTASRTKAKTTQRTGSSNSVRQRSLFARRGQYERQSVPKRVVPPPTKVVPIPVKPMCYQLGQSCLPQSSCCETHSVCHCHFFNAICFCRRTNSGTA